MKSCFLHLETQSSVFEVRCTQLLSIAVHTMLADFLSREEVNELTTANYSIILMLWNAS